METSGIRFYKFKDDDIYNTLKEKGEVFETIKGMQEQVDKIEEDSKPVTARFQKLKDKAITLIKEKLKGVELGEFEVFQGSDIDGDEVAVKIVDLIEEEKLRIRALKENEAQNSSSNEGVDSLPDGVGAVEASKEV